MKGNKMKKIISLIIGSLFITQLCFGAWDASKPADNTKLKDAPALIRANNDAIATSTDPALQITNAKVAANAGIVDTKLAQITTPNKVSAAAITGLASMPSNAGPLPLLNGGTGQTTKEPALNALLPTQTGLAGKALITNGSTHSFGYPDSLTIASAAQGDLLYYTGSAWARFPPGTSGYLLKSMGAGATPVWLQTLPTANGGTGSTANANAANGVVVLDANVKLPAVDGSQLTNLNAGVNPYKFYFHDDFMGQSLGEIGSSGISVYSLGWALQGFHLNASWVAGQAGRLGIIKLSPTFNSIGNGCLTLGYSTSGTSPYNSVLVNAGLQCEFAFYINELSTAGDEYTLRLGLGDSDSADFVDGVYFEYKRTTSVNWIINTANNSTRTKTTSSVAVATGWHYFKFVINSAATSIEYSIDGTSLGTIATNIPTSTGRECAPIIQIIKTAENGVTNVWELDYYALSNTIGTAR